MPKKLPASEKREWLRRYEEGEAEATIAKDEHRDLNVIKRGIEEAKNERRLSLAQSEMLKDALRKHQDKLLAVMTSLLGALVIPPPDLELPRNGVNSANSIKLSGAQIDYDTYKGLLVTLDAESGIHWELLREHLKRDRLWKRLEEWKDATTQHTRARMGLKLHAETLLTANTGLRALDNIDNAPGDDYLYYPAVGLLYRIALDEAIQTPNREGFREEMLVIEKPRIKYAKGDMPLVHFSELKEGYRAGIIKAFEKIMSSAKVGEVKSTYEILKEATDKARRIAEEINLLGLIPGQCRVCRRLGM
ncbi:MAG: hypothetical protein PHI12_10320 [Dehalococcoidales bacterium]|nr:hypothetical protein [Dehalococcoidales bacterium]